MKILKTASYKKIAREMIRDIREQQEDSDEDHDRVQGLIDNYNSYGPNAYSFKEVAPGIYTLIGADSIKGENKREIMQGSLWDIEARMKQILHENGIDLFS